MDEGLAAIAAAVAFVAGVCALIFRGFQVLAGLGWIFSREFRQRIATDHPALRWIVYEGVLYVIVAIGVLVALVGAIVALR